MIERGKISIKSFSSNTIKKKKNHPKPTSNTIKPPIVDTQIRDTCKIKFQTKPSLVSIFPVNWTNIPYWKIKYKTLDCRSQFRNKLSLMVNCIQLENIFRVRNRDSRISSSFGGNTTDVEYFSCFFRVLYLFENCLCVDSSKIPRLNIVKVYSRFDGDLFRSKSFWFYRLI